MSKRLLTTEQKERKKQKISVDFGERPKPIELPSSLPNDDPFTTPQSILEKAYKQLVKSYSIGEQHVTRQEIEQVVGQTVIKEIYSIVNSLMKGGKGSCCRCIRLDYSHLNSLNLCDRCWDDLVSEGKPWLVPCQICGGEFERQDVSNTQTGEWQCESCESCDD